MLPGMRLLDHPEVMHHVIFFLLNSLKSDKWLVAIKSAMNSMYENQVRTLVDPLEGIKPIGCKWVFKKKIDRKDNVVTYKARLVAK